MSNPNYPQDTPEGDLIKEGEILGEAFEARMVENKVQLFVGGNLIMNRPIPNPADGQKAIAFLLAVIEKANTVPTSLSDFDRIHAELMKTLRDKYLQQHIDSVHEEHPYMDRKDTEVILKGMYPEQMQQFTKMAALEVLKASEKFL